MTQNCLAALSIIVLATTQLCIRPSVSFAQMLPGSVPTVSLQTFEPGKYWTWEYHEGKEFYSSERYTVLEKSGDRILIEMSTRLDSTGTYRPHHRIEVSLQKCLDAYANPVSRRPWSLLMCYLDGNKTWQPFKPETTLAFEEKFNCNPHVYRGYGASYRTVFIESADGGLFEQKRWGRLDGTRFFFSGRHAGVGAEKHFAKPKGESYSFRFVTPEINEPLVDGV